MSRCILLLVALAAGAATAHNYGGQCNGIRGMEPFDPIKFAGDWYVVSGSDKELGNTHCTKMHFYVTNATEEEKVPCDTRHYAYNMTFTSLGTEGKAVVHAVMQSYHGMNSKGIGVTKMEGSDKWSNNYYTTFPITDYDNYMIFTACWTAFDPSTLTFETHSVARVYSRHPGMSDDLLKTLRNLLTALNIDVTKHIVQDQSKCSWE